MDKKKLLSELLKMNIDDQVLSEILLSSENLEGNEILGDINTKANEIIEEMFIGISGSPEDRHRTMIGFSEAEQDIALSAILDAIEDIKTTESYTHHGTSDYAEAYDQFVIKEKSTDDGCTNPIICGDKNCYDKDCDNSKTCSDTNDCVDSRCKNVGNCSDLAMTSVLAHCIDTLCENETICNDTGRCFDNDCINTGTCTDTSGCG